MNLWTVLFFPVVFAVKEICPDKTSKCPVGSTCCELLDKTYGCCPLINAVCCDDHIHCCPANSKCSADMCIQNLNATVESNLPHDVTCPDKQSYCPDDTTCCKDPVTLQYGCCPIKDAVCCSDGRHCCPSDTFCDLEKRKCIGHGFITPMYDGYKHPTPLPDLQVAKFLQISLSQKQISSVVCPDFSSQCPDGDTCCKLPSGEWGCCPFNNANCCKDGLHCCPGNMHCDATSQYCRQGISNITALRKIPAKSILQYITCPDLTKCDSGDTCCNLSETRYGCCPYQDAMCCSDFLHCCPSGHDCDVEHKQCVPRFKLADASDNYINYFEL